MRHHRLKVLLLSLGVVFGYGSALAHFVWHHQHGGWHHACEDAFWAPAASEPAPPHTPPKAP
jgi:hypothetical protein